MVDKGEQRFSLYVSRLSRNVQAGHLEEIFGSFGSVIAVDVDVDRRNGMPKGTAVVEFSVAKDAENALVYLNGGQIDGATIIVSDSAFVSLTSDTARTLERSAQVANAPVNATAKDRTKRSRDWLIAGDGDVRMLRKEQSATAAKYEPKERTRTDTSRGNSRVHNGPDMEVEVGRKGVRDSSRARANSRGRRTQPVATHYGPASAPASRYAESSRNEQQGGARGVYGPASVGGPRAAYVPKARNDREGAGRGRSPVRRPRSPVAEGRRPAEVFASRRRDSPSRSRGVRRSPYRGRRERSASPSPRRGHLSESPQRYRRRYSRSMSMSSRSSSGGRPRGRRYSSSRSRSSSWDRGRTRRPRYSRSRSGSQGSDRGGRRLSRSSSRSSSEGYGRRARGRSRSRSFSRSSSSSRSRSRSGSSGP